MGCVPSVHCHGDLVRRRRPKRLGDVAVFFPGLRLPIDVDFSSLLGHGVSPTLVDRLAGLRARAAAVAAREASSTLKFNPRTTKNHGILQDNTIRALEEYLPVLLFLLEEGFEIADKVEFSWINLVDDADETSIGNVWYEVLSVLHLMAMLSFLHANKLLLPIRLQVDGLHQEIIEENRRISVEILLKAAGYLHFAVHRVLPRLPSHLREDIPLDLSEAMLRSLCQQALGQAVEVQLEMAVDSPMANLAVKRRFSCEMVTYWSQALENLMLMAFPSVDGWGLKEQLYLKWKYVEAKAAAYYYHALVLKEKNEDKSYETAVAALRTAEWLLDESRKACEDFNSAPPHSRTIQPLSSIENLDAKITRDASLASRISSSFQFSTKCQDCAPQLPKFITSLTPDEYELPEPGLAFEGSRIRDYVWICDD